MQRRRGVGAQSDDVISVVSGDEFDECLAEACRRQSATVESHSRVRRTGARRCSRMWINVTTADRANVVRGEDASTHRTRHCARSTRVLRSRTRHVADVAIQARPAELVLARCDDDARVVRDVTVAVETDCAGHVAARRHPHK